MHIDFNANLELFFCLIFYGQINTFSSNASMREKSKPRNSNVFYTYFYSEIIRWSSSVNVLLFQYYFRTISVLLIVDRKATIEIQQKKKNINHSVSVSNSLFEHLFVFFWFYSLSITFCSIIFKHPFLEFHSKFLLFLAFTLHMCLCTLSKTQKLSSYHLFDSTIH